MSNTAYLSTGAILTGIEIYEQVQSGKIIIDPFTIDRLNPNSYNLRLSNKLKVYDWGKFDKPYIDSHVKNNPIKEIEIPEDGLVLYPNKLYIGSTIERTATDHFIPVLDGRSSGGRMGLLVHVCAGYGDIGFDGTWTLEIVVIEPLRIYPGDEVAQVTFFTPFGYTGYKYRGRYYGQSDPTESKFAEDKKEEWAVDFTDGSVAFGSAYHNWAINVPTMQETGVNFKDIIDYCNEDKQKELAQKVPLSDVLLGMVVEHLPSPKVSQQYRVPNIWDGDIESPAGNGMITTNPDGPLAVMVTNVSVDKHAGEIATGRVYGGSIEKGTEVYLVGSHSKSRVQQVGVYFGPERVNTDAVPAGNIVYIAGAKGAIAGETICSPEDKIKEFEGLEHISEPVVTVAVEAKNTKDLPKLIEVLRQVAKEDPTIKVDINEETGEHLVSGMGELHLEVIGYRIQEKGVDIQTSEPIVVYRETVSALSPEVEGKSPNKHNRFYITVEPLEDELFKALQEGDLKEGRVKGKEAANDFMEYGLDKEEARRVWSVHNRSLFINMTRGIQYLDEVKELLLEGFESALEDGPLANEIAMGLKLKLHDAKLHEDAVHRGPAQVLPAIRKAIYAAIMSADPALLEPMQKVFISTPQDYMGACTREIQNRRGQIVDMSQDTGDMATIESKVPVAEMFGFAGDIRSAAEGRCLWSTEMAGFERLPREMQKQIVKEIRQRKGLSDEPYGPEHYLG